MLDEIYACFERNAQTFGRRGVRFRDEATCVDRVDNDFLRAFGKADEDGIPEMRCPTELEEVDAKIEVPIDRDAQRIWLHVHQFFAAASRDGVLHLFLEQPEVFGRSPREREGPRPSPAYDVAGKEESRTDGLSTTECFARRRERRDHTVGVGIVVTPTFRCCCAASITTSVNRSW